MLPNQSLGCLRSERVGYHKTREQANIDPHRHTIHTTVSLIVESQRCGLFFVHILHDCILSRVVAKNFVSCYFIQAGYFTNTKSASPTSEVVVERQAQTACCIRSILEHVRTCPCPYYHAEFTYTCRCLVTFFVLTARSAVR